MKPKPQDRVTIRLGELAEPLAKFCKKKKVTISEATRSALAEMLDTDEPIMKMGRPANAEGNS